VVQTALKQAEPSLRTRRVAFRQRDAERGLRAMKAVFGDDRDIGVRIEPNGAITIGRFGKLQSTPSTGDDKHDRDFVL
jgi:hypothetical protein